MESIKSLEIPILNKYIPSENSYLKSLRRYGGLKKAHTLAHADRRISKAIAYAIFFSTSE